MCKSQDQSINSKQHKFTNRLINETSPYLLQHAHNPVDWHPWGEEALKKAKKEDKLLIISIGYAACHWCHVMEHESFEDTTVARIMNEYFVPIKVDREERPDIDDIYMTACNLVSGRGGWPLNAFALPDGRPVWAGTYFPKEQWVNILNQFIQLKENSAQQLEDSADRITKGIQSVDELDIALDVQPFQKEEIKSIVENFKANIDYNQGGRRGSPKFPMPNNLEFLLKYHAIENDRLAFDGVKITLDKMMNGGIYDHVGGGFARYSTDTIWKVPHFEKMLYDNAQLVSLYSHAYRFTRDEKYRDVIIESLEFIDRELSSETGGFYSSLDADSDGIEGKYYVWTWAEIDSLLAGKLNFDAFCKYYNIKPEGNWEEETNIMHVSNNREEIAKQYNLTYDELTSDLSLGKELLLKARQNRIKPGLDNKILTSWNALMIMGYIDAYKAFHNESYLNKALKNTNFLLENQMSDDYRLNRNFKDGRSSINAFLDDYALLIDALIDLYEVTFEEKWLEVANGLSKYTVNHFFNEANSMFYYTSDLDAPLVARKIDINDNVIPASNSIMARNLKSLGELLYNREYLDISEQMIKNMKSNILKVRQPSFYSNWCQLFLDIVYPPYEIAIVGPQAGTLRNEMIQNYIPNAIYLGGEKEGNLQLLEGKLSEGNTLIYVCQNKTCKFPVDTVEKALDLIGK